MRKILREQRILARDQNKVFVELAKIRPRGPKDIEDFYQLDAGKGNAYIEFDVEEQELTTKYNSRIRHDEQALIGNVDLMNRNAIAKRNI